MKATTTTTANRTHKIKFSKITWNREHPRMYIQQLAIRYVARNR